MIKVEFMMKTRKSTLIFLSCFLVASCIKTEQNFELPGIDVQLKNWNTSFVLVDDPMLSNSYRNGKDLTLRVKNLSTHSIVFQENFGVKVYYSDGQNWKIIQNNSYNSGFLFLPTEKSSPLGLLVTVLPYVANLSSPIVIKIVILGYEENNNQELLGAYYDTTLIP